jgi:hypothetical protein
MTSPSEQAQVVFRKIRQVKDEIKSYCLGGDRPDLSIVDLVYVAQQMYAVKITLEEVAFEGSFLSGLIERDAYGNARIFIKHADSYDMRFAAIKEICHVIIDEKDDWSSFGASTISTLLSDYFMTNGSMANVLKSEILAEIAAIELAYPYEDRIRDRSAYLGGSLTSAKISGFHKIPEVFVSRSQTERYHSTMGHMWGGIVT